MDVDLFVSDVDVIAPFDKTTILRASDGSPAIFIGTTGRSLSVSNLSRTGEFYVKTKVDLSTTLPGKNEDKGDSK